MRRGDGTKSGAAEAQFGTAIRGGVACGFAICITVTGTEAPAI